VLARIHNVTGWGEAEDELAVALAAARAEERARRDKLHADLRALVSDFDANGNGCPLGDPGGNAWRKAADRVRAVLDADR
jgi:hypothetical protein